MRNCEDSHLGKFYGTPRSFRLKSELSNHQRPTKQIVINKVLSNWRIFSLLRYRFSTSIIIIISLWAYVCFIMKSALLPRNPDYDINLHWENLSCDSPFLFHSRFHSAFSHQRCMWKYQICKYLLGEKSEGEEIYLLLSPTSSRLCKISRIEKKKTNVGNLHAGNVTNFTRQPSWGETFV